MNVQLWIRHGMDRILLDQPAGASPFTAIRKNIAAFGHACNGQGTCGKCVVRVDPSSQNAVSEPEEAEWRLLGRDAIEEGYRLACLLKVHSDAELWVEQRERMARIAVAERFDNPAAVPFVQKQLLQVANPSLEDQRSDLQRFSDALQLELPGTTGFSDAALAHMLPAALRLSSGKVTCFLQDGRLAGVEGGDCTGSLVGVSCDIGTTTLAGCLVSLSDGRVLATETRLNSQKRYGSDVIARIRHTMENSEGANDLAACIRKDLVELSRELCQKADLGDRAVDVVVVTGNTTMEHLLMGWPTSAIAAAPFIPASLQEVVVSAVSAGLQLAPHTALVVLPAASAYVGADTVSAVLACGMQAASGPCLLVDLGTNGELVLGGKEGLTACSTAAGPAFEGAGIRHGMGAVEGAVDGVMLETKTNGEKEYSDISLSVLGGGKPEGLCGTGLLDAMALLLNLEIIDASGRLQDVESWPDTVPEALHRRLVVIDGQPAFQLSDENGGGRGPLVLTQRDIREFQNAKAAVHAGILTLADVAGISLEKVETVYLAGGFGTWLKPESALATGLLPEVLEGRIQPVGNAALAGATHCLISADIRSLSREIAEAVKVVELSGRRDFQERYVEAMLFGDL